ncbi:MAG: spore maturation protein [Deltaproteobacteria bacterium]|nr:spore maturation protein [Deltaproteobacteria bacterium]
MKQKASVINIIWLSMVVLATVTAAYTNRMDALTKASFESAKDAVVLAIGLIGPMALWLGIMKVAEAGGLMRIVARWVRPLMVRLFPDVPHDHPATPMGIKAMQELEKLAPEKGTATNAMCLFLAINTSSVTLLPLGVITIRAAAGATSPAAIFIPSLIATTCSTIVAIVAAKMLARGNSGQESVMVSKIHETSESEIEAECAEPELFPPSTTGKWFIGLLVAAFAGGAVYQLMSAAEPLAFSAASLNSLSSWLIPALISGLLIFGYLRGVRIYETITDGAKEGFTTAMRIIPFMVAIFVAIGMFRASGAMDILVAVLSPLTSAVGMPAEALAMGLLRPLSGSGSFAFMSEIIKQSPDSLLSAMVSVIQGSSETTLYVLAVYFGAIGIRRTRHALPAALCGETAGLIAAVTVCNLWF